MDVFQAVDETYGIDTDRPISTREESVEIPQSTLSDLSYLRQTVDPNSNSDNHGIDLCEQTLQIILSAQHN